ncbi:MAG: hypothetical protein WD824_21580 [Cyclobacteriaceae bacterium]
MSFPRYFQSFVVDFDQVSFNVIPQLRVAVPLEEAEEQARWHRLLKFHFVPSRLVAEFPTP